MLTEYRGGWTWPEPATEGIVCVSYLDQLRTDLFTSVKAAGLKQARQIRDGGEGLPLPTETTIEEFSRWISASAEPVANANLSISAGEFAPGASRVAGTPDMPDGLEWPQHRAAPLAFLAQIDLAALPAGIDWPAPSRGWLYFFLGANPNGIEVGDVDASPHRILYFGGDVSELKPRQPPAGVVIPFEFKNAVPYSISFELGLSVPMGKAGAACEPWEEGFADIASLDLGALLLDSNPAIIREAKDRMFGLPRDDQNDDCRFQAAATTAGFGSVMHLAGLSLEGYRRMATRNPPSPDAARSFEAMKAQQAALEAEAPN